jgi:Domain of unknown function (DUF4276)
LKQVQVTIYVEGLSDKLAMQVLLEPLIEEKRQEGITINFFEAQSGDRKVCLLTITPQRAVNIILNNPDAVVIVMSDLYPKDKAFAHETPEQLEEGIRNWFNKGLQKKGASDDVRYQDRFKVFCFKHDLEALLLASSEAVRTHLGLSKLSPTWVIPVEDQNHGCPPKKVLEGLFSANGKKYRDTIHAPLILGRSNYQNVADSCPQCFKPFVSFLENL